MTYKYSNDDKANFKWFQNDHTRQSLRSIELTEGSLRGLYPFRADFQFPITAIAGSNGSGKSTLLALAACAYHNHKAGYKSAGRKFPYHTFSDFFVQSNDELPPQGIVIKYGLSHNSWKSSDPGVHYQSRKKKVGGKWNDYDKRINRNVAYFGVTRVVPHFERSAHKSNRSRFKSIGLNDDVSKKIALIAGRIIGKKYDNFESQEHLKYSLPRVSSNGFEYTGFNMGAGESAVFEILTTLFTIGTGALLIIDEIELGLHERAQYRFIEELKQVCLNNKCQIICSTHSFAILSSLPPEARIFIEASKKTTTLITGISPEFACGKMGGKDAHELDIFVEDLVAKKMLEEWLPSSLRKRIKISSIGSHAAVIKVLATRYLEKRNNCFCILDGDQRSRSSSALKSMIGHTEASGDAEKGKAESWATERITYLPGNMPPEKWLIAVLEEKAKLNEGGIVGTLMSTWGIDSKQQFDDSLNAALQADAHSEFFTLAEEIYSDKDTVLTDIIRAIKLLAPEDVEEILEFTTSFFDNF